MTREERLAKRSAYTKAWRAANPEYQKRKMKEYWSRPENREKMRVLSISGRRRKSKQCRELKQKPCMDCGGIFHPEAMEWDHRDPKEKLTNVSQARNREWDKFLAEVAKCDLICANCHRVRTARRRAGLPATLPEPEFSI